MKPDDLDICDNHPLASELSSLRGAVSRFQDEAYKSSVKLQRHSLDAANAHERAVHLEQENDLLRSELSVLRANPHPDASPQAHPAVLQVQQLTLSLRRLSDKLSLTEAALLERTTQLTHATGETDKAKIAAESAYELAARTRGREEAGKSRELELERKVKVAEEAVKMSDLVINEYADLVRSLEPKSGMRPSTSSSSVTLNEQDVGSKLIDSLAEGKLGLQRLLSEFSAETEQLQKNLLQIQGEHDTAKSQWDTEKKFTEKIRVDLAQAQFDLQQLKIDDNTAAKMVSRYMKFSQKSTDVLQDALTAMKARHTSTVDTLSAQLSELSSRLHFSESQTEKLRNVLDELGGEMAKEAYGRRREVALRIRMVNREEKLLGELERWVLRAQETLSREQVDPRSVQERMIRDARALLSGGLDEMSASALSDGSLARVITAENAVEVLTTELEVEMRRRLELEQMLVQVAGDTVSSVNGDAVHHSKVLPEPPIDSDISFGERKYETLDELLHENSVVAHASPPQAPSLLVILDDMERSTTPSSEPSSTPSAPQSSSYPLPTIISDYACTPSLSTAVPDSLLESPHIDSSENSKPPEALLAPVYPNNKSDEFITLPSNSHSTYVETTVEYVPESPSHSSDPISNNTQSSSDACPSETATDSANSCPIPHGFAPIGSSSLPEMGRPSSVELVTTFDDKDGKVGVEFSNGHAAYTPNFAEPSDVPPPQVVPDIDLMALPPLPPIPLSPSSPVAKPSILPLPHPLLKELSQVQHRYDDLHRSLRDCHLALETFSKTISTTLDSGTIMGSVPPDVLRTALQRLIDYNEDARVELEIRMADEALATRGFETLLSIPEAISSLSTTSDVDADQDTLSHSDVERQIHDFVSGADTSVDKAKRSLTRKLEDIEHDIAALKRAVHDEVVSPTQPLTTPVTANSAGASWTSWIRSSPASPANPSPIASSSSNGPVPTFGNVMTSPRLRHSPSLNLPGSLGRRAPGQAVRDSFASLGLRVPMPSYIHHIGNGAGQPQPRSRTLSTMYMLGLGRRPSDPLSASTSPKKGLPSGLGTGNKGFETVDDSDEADSDVE